jgi:VWFA-related protein
MLAILAFFLALQSAPAPEAAWNDALARASSGKKPLVVFYRTADCAPCDVFELRTVSHPIIQRRLPAVVFVTLPTTERPNVAWFDETGTLRFRWPIVPDTINFGVILDTVQYGVAHFAPAPPAAPVPIHILPLERQVVSGRQLVKTRVGSTSVSRVAFSLDGREVARAGAPFSTTLDFGAPPERHSIRAVALDRKGKKIGSDERVVNEGGETFWLRLIEPREGSAEGKVRVSMDVRQPAANRVQRVVLSWNEAERAVLTSAPWESAIAIPKDEVGILRAVAELDDGRTSEDAVLLNARGVVDQSNVQLVGLPITIYGSYSGITVREGKRLRRVESIATAAETPLTVGLLIDASDSMETTLPDLEEAAIRFLDTILGPHDRAFIIEFESRARLMQPATSDKTLLRQRIMSIRPEGLTALYDAIALGLLQFEGVKGRRAMVVFTDGIDITSRYRASEVGALAGRVSVPLHIIGSSDDELKRAAQRTGGTSRTLYDLAELPGIFAEIEASLRAQILAFIRTEPAAKENDWRSIDVEVTGDGAHVFAPAGYYTAW